MSAHYDITAEVLEAANFRAIHAGDDYDHGFSVTRGGATLPITGATLWFTVKEDSSQTDAEAKLQLKTGAPDNKIEITDGAAGEFTVHFKAADTANLEGEWPYDLKAKLSGGQIIRLARGVIQFLPNLTRATT